MNLTYLEIDHNRGPYDALKGEARAAFNERLVLSYLYHDHALEGVPLSRREIDRALEGKPCRNYCDGEIKKSLRRLKKAFGDIREDARDGEDLSIEWIKDRHVHMCDDDDEAAGRYRQRNTSPGVYNLDIVKSGSLSYHFHKFIEDYREEYRHYHPVRAAAVAHWEFMHVFPYDDRTGIVGRLMLNFLLMRADYPPATIHAMDRHHYFKALRGHRSDMVNVVVDGVKATISAAEEFASQWEDVQSATPEPFVDRRKSNHPRRAL